MRHAPAMTPLANPFALALKAGLGIVLAVTLVRLFGNPDALSAGFAALACTTPVVVTGMRRGFDQLAGSLAGGLVSTALLLALPNQPWVAGLAAFVTVLLIFRLALAGTYLIAGFTVLYVFFVPSGNPADLLETRLLALACGVGAATLVNVVVSATAYRSIFARRVRVVRLTLVDAYRTLAYLAEAAPDRASRAFEPVWPLIVALQDELRDASRETRLPHAGEGALDTPRALIRHLDDAAHVGRELGHLAAASPAQAVQVRGAARALVALLTEGANSKQIPLGPAIAGVFARARAHAERIHALGTALDRAPRSLLD